MSPLDVFWDRSEGTVVFGSNDCCMTVADVIVAAGGPDLMQAYRGRYRTARGFVRAFRKAGHGTLFSACQAALSEFGAPVEKPYDFDVAVVTYPDGPSRQMTTAPAFYHGGFWHIRTDRAGLVLAHSAFQGVPSILRVI